MTTVLIATTNVHKRNELQAFLSDVPVTLITLKDIQKPIPEVVEDGASFQENAIKKATILACTLGFLTLADDSGLWVDYLDGGPGVYSARYAGNEQNDKNNYQKLLECMKSVPEQKRGAEFRCAIALANPDKLIGVVEGVCRGVITKEPKGTYGFGYDPVFYFQPLKKTFAELKFNEKNEVSHRYHALLLAKKLLIKHLGLENSYKKT
jgi:XTP/dITP diphosphohydrolase